MVRFDKVKRVREGCGLVEWDYGEMGQAGEAWVCKMGGDWAAELGGGEVGTLGAAAGSQVWGKRGPERGTG